MVKYFAVLVVLAGSLVAVGSAEARGHHRGCSSCGGCPGGVCYAPGYAAPMKTAGVAPTGPVVAAATTPAPAPTYYASTPRRGLFGFRR